MSETSRRIKLWRRDPRCFWCLRPTRLDAPPRFHDFATVDHLFPRGDERRFRKERGPNVEHVVLACWGCNHSRGNRSCAEFRLLIADTYYRSLGRQSPSDPWSASSYLKHINNYERDTFLEWAHRASSPAMACPP